MASPSNADRLLGQMKALNDDGAFQSAVVLGSMLMACSSLSKSLQGECLGCFADALSGLEEWRRAVEHYRRAIQVSSRRGSKTPTSRARSASSDTAAEVATWHLKAARCLVKLGDTHEAVTTLEMVHTRSRTLPIQLLLGRLYRESGVERAATSAYREAVRMNPYAIEAVVALIELCPTANAEISALLSPGGSIVTSKDSSWIQKLAEGHTCVRNQQLKQSQQLFASLDRTFPNNLYGKLQSAKDTTTSIASFERCRAIDPLNMDGMDVFAETLWRTHNMHGLNRLAHDLMDIDPRRPEPWLAAALCTSLGGDHERALTFVRKATAKGPRNQAALRSQGRLLAVLGRHDDAKTLFLRALVLGKDLSVYKGLVQAYLALGKHKEAMLMAREATQLMPRSAGAVTLIGVVHVAQASVHASVLADRQDEYHEKAKRAFLKALSLDRLACEPLLALAKLCGQTGATEEGIKLLKQGLEQHNDEALHAALAGLYTSMEDYEKAMQHYHSALSINSNLVAASEGLERLEKLMRGVDPDAEDDETEAEDAEVEGSFETSEYMT